MWLAGAFGLKGDLDAAYAELAEARRLEPEIDSLARWRASEPCVAAPEYWSSREQTVNVGLRRAGFAEE
jgi:adenylate cyclase